MASTSPTMRAEREGGELVHQECVSMRLYAVCALCTMASLKRNSTALLCEVLYKSVVDIEDTRGCV